MVDWKYRLARTIIHLRIYVLIFSVAISVCFVFILKDIQVETRLEDFLPQKHPFIEVQHRLNKTFGGLNQVSIALTAKQGDILQQNFIEKTLSLTEDLEVLEGVNLARINSIASRHIKHVVANDEGFFVERLLRTTPQTNEEMAELKARLLANPSVYGRLVSRDFKSTLLQVDFESQTKTTEIFSAMKSLKKKYEDDLIRIDIAGRPMLEGWLNHYLPRMIKILLISFLVFSMVLYMTFRSKRGMILPLLDSTLATLWGMGAMKLMGLRLDPSTILVPFIVLSLGISHSVHALKRYYEEMSNPAMKSKHAIVNTMTHLFIPGMACVLTDGFGFLSLLWVPLPTIRSMATASGLGILANFFTSFVFTPCLLSWMHRPKILEVKREETHKWVDLWLSRLSVFSLNKRAGTLVVVIFLLSLAVSIVGIRQIVIGDNSEGTSYLYPDSPYNVSENFINQNFGGTNSFFVLVESPQSLLRTAPLLAMDDFQSYLFREVPQVGSSQSIVQAIKALNMFMFEGDRKQYRIPDQDETIAQYWFLYTLSGFPFDYDHLISRDESIANIKFDVKDYKASTVNMIIARTRKYFQDHSQLPARFFYAGGDIGVLKAINEIISRNILPNILMTSTLVFLYVAVMFRSVVAGWLLFLPLVFSNLVVFSLFGFLGRSITSATLPLASLSVGLGINYGIYILARLYDEIREKKRTYKEILHHTLITSGKAVFFSGFIVSSGILAWIFSPILFQARLGFDLCFVLILNMIISLVIIPVFVWWIKPMFLFGRLRQRHKKIKRVQDTNHKIR